MNIIDYLLGSTKDKIYRDDAGNMYLEKGCEDHPWIHVSEYMTDTREFYFLSKEEYDRFGEYDISIAEDITGDILSARRPYYRMRGKPVTEEQAFDIIRRTDHFFSYIDAVMKHPDRISSWNFDNWIIQANHHPKGYGWIHTDGTVGANAITQKFPRIEEFVWEWYQNLVSFPYLDLIIAVTDWDEGTFWDGMSYVEGTAFNERFSEGVVLGIYVHDHKVEILNRTDALARYEEYNALYGEPGEKFEPEYYEENRIQQVELPYLRRCIEAYGLNADEELGRVSKYVWDWEARRPKGGGT